MNQEIGLNTIRDLQRKDAELVREREEIQVAIKTVAKVYGLDANEYSPSSGDGASVSPKFKEVKDPSPLREVDAPGGAGDKRESVGDPPPHVPGYPYKGNYLAKTRFILKELGKGQRSDIKARAEEIEGAEVSSSTLYDNLKRLEKEGVAIHHKYDDPRRRQDNYFEWVGEKEDHTFRFNN